MHMHIHTYIKREKCGPVPDWNMALQGTILSLCHLTKKKTKNTEKPPSTTSCLFFSGTHEIMLCTHSLLGFRDTIPKMRYPIHCAYIKKKHLPVIHPCSYSTFRDLSVWWHIFLVLVYRRHHVPQQLHQHLQHKQNAEIVTDTATFITERILIVLILIFLHVSYRDKENAQCYFLLRHIKVTGIPSNVPFMHCNCILLFKHVTQFLEIYHWTQNEGVFFSPCG